MFHPKEPREVAAILADLYDLEFQGKSNGRFRISRNHFRELAGKTNLREAFIEDVQEACNALEFELITIGDTFVFLNTAPLLRYRETPLDIIRGYRPRIPREDAKIFEGSRVTKDFGDEEEYEGTVLGLYGNGKIFVEYDDGDFEITAISEVKPVEEELEEE